MKKKLRYLIVISLVVLVVLVGCRQNSSNDSDDEMMTLVFGTSPWPTSMFAYLADDLGIFEANGLEVELNNFGSFGDSLQAFVGGNLDIMTAPSSDAIAPYSRGADFDVIMLTDKSMGSDGMVARNDIQSIEDLAGKTVATEFYTVNHMYLLSLLHEGGMGPDDLEIVNMTIADAGTAFIAGNVDAAVVWEPYLSRTLEQGDGHLLYSTVDTPDLITDAVLANRTAIDNDPDAIQAFVQSWYEAVEYWRDNQEESEIIMAEYLEVSPEEFADMMDKLYITTVEDAIESFESTNETSFSDVNQTIAEFLLELEVIETVPNVSDMLNTDFLHEVDL